MSDNDSEAKPTPTIKNTTADNLFNEKFNLNSLIESDSGNRKIRQKSSEEIKNEILIKERQKLAQYNKQEYISEKDQQEKSYFELLDTTTKQAKREVLIRHTNEKYADLVIMQWEKRNRFKRVQKRYGHITAKILQGRLGVDNFFLLFGLLAAPWITIYFYNRQLKMQKISVLKDIDPKIIENLDENSEIDLDDVSVHATFYDMTESREYARKERLKEKIKNDQIEDVYSKGWEKVDQIERSGLIRNEHQKVEQKKPPQPKFVPNTCNDQ